jgi:hypothetical protein
MPKLFQMPGEAAFAAAYVDRQSARRREKLKELVAVIIASSCRVRGIAPSESIGRPALPSFQRGS